MELKNLNQAFHYRLFFFLSFYAFNFLPSRFSLPITLPQFDAHWKSIQEQRERESEGTNERRMKETGIVELKYKRQTENESITSVCGLLQGEE